MIRNGGKGLSKDGAKRHHNLRSNFKNAKVSESSIRLLNRSHLILLMPLCSPIAISPSDTIRLMQILRFNSMRRSTTQKGEGFNWKSDCMHARRGMTRRVKQG